MHRARPTVVAVALLLTTAVAAPALTGVVAAQNQGQQISECTTVNESGTYELNGSIGVNESADATNGTDDAAANETAADEESNDTALPAETGVVEDDANASACLAVEASDVTLDGNGYTVDGSNASALNVTGNGTNASDGANASAEGDESVVNGIVVRPPAENGTVSNVTISNVTVQHWYVGVYIQDAQDVTLDNVTFANNTVPGFRLDNATGLSIQNANQTVAQGN